MKIDTLISTMRRDDLSFFYKMNIKSGAIIINQFGSVDLVPQGIGLEVVNIDEKGVSRSRNLAIKKSKADLCILADDDIKYVDNAVNLIKHAHEEYPNADIIAFIVDRLGDKRGKQFRKEMHWENQFSLFKISGVEITFKRKNIIDSNLFFNEDIGPGTSFYQGEDSVFLSDAKRKGLNILYLPIKIGETDLSESSWFEGYNEAYFESKGVSFYLMNPKLYPLLYMQFLIRKHDMYKNYTPLQKAFKAMFVGRKKYLKSSEKNAKKQ